MESTIGHFALFAENRLNIFLTHLFELYLSYDHTAKISQK